VSDSSIKKALRTPIFVVMLVAIAGAIATIVIVSASDALKQPATLPENPYPSIEIEMPKITYQVGERLDFTIRTYGICATPNVSIWRDTGNGESILVYQYVAEPIRCPQPQSPDQPHLKWKADQLVRRISDENFGGDGDSVVTTSAAITLKKAANYVISASLPDRSKDVSAGFTVMDARVQ
jgi:hypothetical protein